MDTIQSLKTDLGASWRQCCRLLGVAWSSLRGWCARLRAGLPLLRPPGPKPAGVLDHKALDSDLRSLGPDGKRCRGSGAVYAKHRHAISRRDFRRRLKDAKKRRRQSLSRTTWSHPMLVWAIDDTHVGYDLLGGKIWSTTVQDLHSSYKLDARVGRFPKGKAIAAYLESLFIRYGAPLILKRDNGSNFNQSQVDDLLQTWGVITLNSPAYTPQYNGAIEHAQAEIKGELGDRSPRPIVVWKRNIDAAYLTLNRKPRRRLQRRNAQEIFTPRHDAAMFSPEQRQQARTDIDRVQQSLLDGKAPTARPTASSWRNAVTLWLEEKGLITISRPQPSPY